MKKKSGEMGFKLIYFILLSCCTTAKLFAANIDLAADQILKEFKPQHRLLAMGEISHEEPRNHKIAFKLMKKGDFKVLGLELPSSIQEHLDQAVTPDSDFESAWNIIKPRLRYERDEVLKEILLLLREKNKAHKEIYYRVIGLDLSQAGYKEAKAWFLDRDPHMLKTLNAATRDLQDKAVVMLGFGHTSKSALELPKSAQKRFELPSQIENLGFRLQADEETRSKVLSVYLDSPIKPIHQWAFLPPEYQSIIHWGKAMRNANSETHLLRMNGYFENQDMHKELHAEIIKRRLIWEGERFYGLDPTRNADLILVWEKEHQSILENCADALSFLNPKLLLRGALLRLAAR